jgi:hypothetical protein
MEKEEVYKRNLKNSEDLEQRIEFLKLVYLSSFTQQWIVLRLSHADMLEMQVDM